MIAQQLRQLEAHGLLEKKAYAEVPPRVEYTLTPYGQSLAPLLQLMSEWGSIHWYMLDPWRCLPNGKYRDMLFEIITDELKHSAKYNDLFTVNVK